jgi:hypothetical protein
LTSRPLRRGAFLAAFTLVLSTAALASPVPPCRPTVVCAVEVTDLSAVVRGSGDYHLLVPGQAPTLIPRDGIAHVALVEPTLVRLDGAAYHGSIEINPADCGGERVHTIAASLKPARLEFHVGAVPLADLVVSCVEGCPYQLRPADDFPELPFPRDDHELTIELEFKARGHRSQTAEFRLNPGVNPIRVTMARVE